MSHKFNAKRTGEFPSLLEKETHDLLLLREKAKEITNIKRQVRIVLDWPEHDRFATKVDFSFDYVLTGTPGFAEAKGNEDSRWKKIKRYWKKVGPAPLEVFKGRYKKGFCIPQLVEVIYPENNE